MNGLDLKGENVLNLLKVGGTLYYLIQVKEQAKQRKGESFYLVASQVLDKEHPQAVIAYYERITCWNSNY